ncbi:11257_t:CDS:2, partial [Entrophospora sp. SA101]
IVTGTLAILYILKNADRIVGLGAPEPLARLYSRNYYRATWILSALDAGFLTAMSIRPKILRDIMSLVFSIYYLVFADQADEKIRRIRATITVEHLRCSFEKTMNPYLRFLIKLTHPRLQIFRKKIIIPRPKKNSHGTRPVIGYLYYSGNEQSLKNNCDKLILNYSGGGFVAMNPICHEDYLCNWVKKVRVPILSIDYGKAPEFPYPYALEECFDAYQSIMESNGEVIGMAGWHDQNGNDKKQISIVLIGDSAWMPQDQLSVIKAESASTNSISSDVLESKDHLGHKSPLAVVPDVKKGGWKRKFSKTLREKDKTIEERVKFLEGHEVERGNDISEKNKRTLIGTRLTMTSRVSYFSDRIITPDMMRAMAILYIGPNNCPDFNADYLLSPIIAPDELLAQFPKTYLLCGEKDPFVDDTIIFAGRLREAKKKKSLMTLVTDNDKNNNNNDNSTDDNIVQVKIIEGVSHAFLQMLAFLPECRGAIRTVSRWFVESFQEHHRQSKNSHNLLINETSSISNNNNSNNTQNLKSQQTDNFQITMPSQIPFNQISKSDSSNPDTSDSSNNDSHDNENITHLHPHHPHVTLPEPVLTPAHEHHDHFLWEKENILNENEILKRRTDTFIKHLAEGCNTTIEQGH